MKTNKDPDPDSLVSMIGDRIIESSV